MVQQSDNSGMGVILGVLLAVVIAIGAYFFFTNTEPGQDAMETTNIEMPDVNISPASGDNDAPASSPAQ